MHPINILLQVLGNRAHRPCAILEQLKRVNCERRVVAKVCRILFPCEALSSSPDYLRMRVGMKYSVCQNRDSFIRVIQKI